MDEYFIILSDFVEPNLGGVAVDAHHVYWADAECIGRANLDGTGIDPCFINFSGPPDPFREPTFPMAVAVDGDHVYWAAWGDTASNGTIGRANLNGSGAERNFITGVGAPNGVAVDDVHVYWTNQGNGATNGTIVRANLDGTGLDPNFIAAGSLNVTGVAVDGLPPPPSNDFSFGKVKKNKRDGRAKLTVNVPGGGDLVLAKTQKVRAAGVRAEVAGKVELPIKPKGKAKKKLSKKGKVKVKAKVTYIPDGGEPNTERKKIKLVKR